jgi:hypothetical protein
MKRPEDLKTENLFVSSPLDLLSNVPAESTGPEALLSGRAVRKVIQYAARKVIQSEGGSFYADPCFS